MAQDGKSCALCAQAVVARLQPRALPPEERGNRERAMPIPDLPGSNLALDRDELVKYGPNDNGSGAVSHRPVHGNPNREIEGVGIPVVLVSVFASLAFVSYRFIESPGWSWAATIPHLLGVCALGA